MVFGTPDSAPAKSAAFARLLLAALVCLLGNLLWCQHSVAAAVELKKAEQYYLSLEPMTVKDASLGSDPMWIPTKDQLVPVPITDARTQLWYRFDIHNGSEAKEWYLLTTNTLLAHIQVYTMSVGEEHHRHNGYVRRFPFDLSNNVALSLPTKQAVSVWVKLEAPYVGQQPLFSLMPGNQYPQHHFNYTSMILIAIGAMLALVLYNAFLYFPTRDSSFIWYAGYQLLCTFAWAMHFKVMLYCFDIPLDASTLYLPFFIAGAASLMFAISFLKLPQGGWLALLVRACAIALVVFGLLGLILPVVIYQWILMICIYSWICIMLGLGIWRLNQGYRPARIYVAGFGILGTYFLFTLAGNLAGTSLFDNQLLWALWMQLIDAIALALALADRINFLRKSRQHADKRASTDQLTGLPNRTAFERDIRAWEAYYSEGIIQDFFLTFIDVDGLKRVNDRHGHNEGDRLLSLVAQWLSRQSQQQNIYRIGGDEFVLLSRKQIQWNLTSLHKLLTDEGFPNSDLSIGTSSYSESGSRSTLLKLADERMYAIKHSNR